MNKLSKKQRSIGSVFSRLGLALAFAMLFLGMTTPAEARDQIRVPHENIQFEFGDQGGEWAYSCKHRWLEHAENWAVTCADPEGRGATWNFTVHFRLFAFSKSVSPKLSYQILYLVTDQQRPPGGQGKYVGTTMWFHLDEPSSLTALYLSQDIQDTYSLRARMNLKGM